MIKVVTSFEDEKLIDSSTIHDNGKLLSVVLNNFRKIINQLPVVSGTGTEVTLNNTIAANFVEFELSGNTEQKTTKIIDTELVNAVIVGGPTIALNDTGRVFIAKTKPNHTYKIARNINSSRFRVCESETEWNKTRNFNLLNQQDLTGLEGEYTTSSTGNYIYVFDWYSGAGDIEDNIPTTTISTAGPNPDYPQPVQVVTGENKVIISNGTDKQELPLSLGNLEFAKTEDAADKIVHDLTTGKWYEHKAINKFILDGNENWKLNTSTDDYSEFVMKQLLPISVITYKNAISSHFSNKTNNRAITYSNQLLVRMPASQNIATADDFKALLSSNNVILYYLLATPVLEEITNKTLCKQLTALENAMSYAAQTNITQESSNLPFNLSVKALKDLNYL